MGIIPKEWEVKTIGEVCDIHVGKDLNLNSYSKICDNTHIYPVYSNTVDANGWYGGYYNFEEYKGNCVTVVGRGVGLGTAFYRDKGFGAIGRLLVLYSDKCDAKYLTEYINGKVEIFAESAAIPQLTGKQIANYRIAVPPIEEQRKISEILSVWDEAIDKQTKLIDALVRRKQALMQQLLIGEKRLLGLTKPWRIVKLGDICIRVIRKNNINNKKVVTISAQKGFVLQTDFFRKSIASDNLDNYYLIKRDEFCYNKSYSNGYPMGVIKRLKKFDKAVVTTLYICFSIKNRMHTYIDFLEQYCDTGLLNKELIKIANEGGRAHGLLNVTPDDFFNIKLRIPEFEEQKIIGKILCTADQEIGLAKNRLEQFQIQKRSLMQQILTGKKRMKI